MKHLSVEAALARIEEEHPEFEDDGLSFFPDWIYRRWKLGNAGRIHDWRYCSRCHPAGSMNQAARSEADADIRRHARELLPWWLRLTPYILGLGTHLGGGTSAWNSCGPKSDERCRHNIEMPTWMKALG
jgi:hypothetical protein